MKVIRSRDGSFKSVWCDECETYQPIAVEFSAGGGFICGNCLKKACEIINSSYEKGDVITYKGAKFSCVEGT